MDFRIGIVIGASLWLVTEQEQPEHQICTRISDIAEPCGCMVETFDLICGSDARTYLSRCFLNCWATLENIKIEIAHEGGCTMESRCTCNSKYDPVCGSNRVTYSNKCVFNCFKKDDNSLRLEHNGECDRSFLNQGEPEKLNEELTTQPPSCPFNNPPPIQRLSSQGCPNQPQACLRTGSEQKSKKNSCICATLHRPVCSKLNATYANFCVLDCIATRNPSVEFQHWGHCGKPLETPWRINSLNFID